MAARLVWFKLMLIYIIDIATRGYFVKAIIPADYNERQRLQAEFKRPMPTT